MLLLSVLFLLGFWMVPPSPLFAGTDDENRFQQANELAAKGKAERALSIYEDLIAETPGDPDLLYNAGTVALQAGRLAPAVRYLERALAVAPDCSDCRANLDRALEGQKDRVIGEKQARTGGSFDAFMEKMHLDALAVTFLVFHLLLFAILLLRRRTASERTRFALALSTGVLFILVLAFGGLLALKAYRYEAARYAVVMVEELPVRKGPNMNYPESFRIHEGLKVRLDERVEDWRRVWLANGLNGYVPEDKLGEI